MLADAGAEAKEGLAFDAVEPQRPAAAPALVIANDEPVLPFSGGYEGGAFAGLDVWVPQGPGHFGALFSIPILFLRSIDMSLVIANVLFQHA